MDIVIIGGGPAGAATAISAGELGLRVVVVCREGYSGGCGASPGGHSPRGPVESIHPGVGTLLDSLGVCDAIDYSRQASYSGIYSKGQFTPLSSDPNEVWYGSHIARSEFDSCLLQRAAASGACILSGERVTGITRTWNGYSVRLSSGQNITARFVIDASGRARIASKILKMRQEHYSRPLTASTGIMAELPQGLFEDTEAILTPEENGWTWLAPLSADTCSWTRLSLTGAPLLPPPSLMNGTLAGPVRTANVRWRRCQPVAENGIFLTGDAAAVLDPGAGQGILIALLSGIMAVRSIGAVVAGEGSLNNMTNAYDDWFGSYFESAVTQLGEYYENMGLSFRLPVSRYV